MAALEQWSAERDSPESVLTAGHSYGLKNLDVDRYVRYGEREYGINLVWASEFSREMFFRKEGSVGEALRYGEPVAIAITNGGYVRYKKREYGINLVWSDDPVYEWKLTGGSDGNTIPYANNRFSLYNEVENDHVVHCERSYGINLRWVDDCSAFADEEARVAINYRIPLGGGGTQPSFGSVSFSGQVTDADGSGGASSFQKTDQWQAPPGSDSALASVSVAGLRTGTWRIEARTPVWVASCNVELGNGSNQTANFEQLKSGCSRGFSFPIIVGKKPKVFNPAGHADEHPRPATAVKQLDAERLDLS